MSEHDETAAVLAQLVPLGEDTPQAQELATAVAQQVSERLSPPPTPRTLGQRLCRLWGLNENRVASITIEIKPDDVVQAWVRMYPDDGLGLVLNAYRLVPKGEEA